MKEKLQIALALERMGVDVMEVGFPFLHRATLSDDYRSSGLKTAAFVPSSLVEKDIKRAAESLRSR
ncbi:hypothetical protein ACNKHK_00475 [Shigella flexneri]